MSFIKNGIDHKLLPNKSRTNQEGQSLQSPQSPKEQWEEKLKAFKIKFLILFVLSHLLWLLNSFGDSGETVIPREAPVRNGHTIVQLPAWNYGEVPPKGSKIEISLFGPEQGQVINGYLRGLVDDPLGETGSKAIIEVPHKELLTIKNAKGPWSIYPSLKNTYSQHVAKDPYEISW